MKHGNTNYELFLMEASSCLDVEDMFFAAIPRRVLRAPGFRRLFKKIRLIRVIRGSKIQIAFFPFFAALREIEGKAYVADAAK